MAVLAQARAGCAVDGVVDARVQRDEAAEQGTVGGVHDRVRAEGGDVALPEHGVTGPRIRRMGELLGEQGKLGRVGAGPGKPLAVQQGVQRPGRLLGKRTRVADGEERAQELACPRVIDAVGVLAPPPDACPGRVVGEQPQRVADQAGPPRASGAVGAGRNGVSRAIRVR